MAGDDDTVGRGCSTWKEVQEIAQANETDVPVKDNDDDVWSGDGGRREHELRFLRTSRSRRGRGISKVRISLGGLENRQTSRHYMLSEPFLKGDSGFVKTFVELDELIRDYPESKWTMYFHKCANQTEAPGKVSDLSRFATHIAQRRELTDRLRRFLRTETTFLNKLPQTSRYVMRRRAVVHSCAKRAMTWPKFMRCPWLEVSPDAAKDEELTSLLNNLAL